MSQEMLRRHESEGSRRGEGVSESKHLQVSRNQGHGVQGATACTFTISFGCVVMSFQRGQLIPQQLRLQAGYQANYQKSRGLSWHGSCKYEIQNSSDQISCVECFTGIIVDSIHSLI